jgi:phosphatidate cytidylyltransferase
MKDLGKRLITAFCILTATGIIIGYASPFVFSIILFAIISLAAYEFVALCQPQKVHVWLLLLNGSIVWLATATTCITLLQAIVLNLFFNGIWFLFSTRHSFQMNLFIITFAAYCLSFMYVFIPLFFFYKLFTLHRYYLILLIAMVVLADSAAYFIGKSMGKRKIFPMASPNKTLAGFNAAIAAAGITAIILMNLLSFPFFAPLWQAVLIGLLIGLTAQLSDPVESLFKRSAQKKDSGTLLPGHGGILDRLDSYIFAAPAFYYCLEYFRP